MLKRKKKKVDKNEIIKLYAAADLKNISLH